MLLRTQGCYLGPRDAAQDLGGLPGAGQVWEPAQVSHWVLCTAAAQSPGPVPAVPLPRGEDQHWSRGFIAAALGAPAATLP